VTTHECRLEPFEALCGAKSAHGREQPSPGSTSPVHPVTRGLVRTWPEGGSSSSIGLRYSWRSMESPINQISGGHKPTKRARRSALPRSSWSTVLARIHSAMQSPTAPSERNCMCPDRNPESWRRFVNMARVGLAAAAESRWFLRSPLPRLEGIEHMVHSVPDG
jgi:hypothetical protein